MKKRLATQVLLFDILGYSIMLISHSLHSNCAVADPELWFAGGDMASAGARAYIWGLGAKSPARSRDKAPGQGVRRVPPEAEKLF